MRPLLSQKGKRARASGRSGSSRSWDGPRERLRLQARRWLSRARAAPLSCLVLLLALVGTAVVLLVRLCWYMHVHSYVWQVTAFAGLWRQPREPCSLLVDIHQTYDLLGAPPKDEQQQLRIAIVLLYSPLMWPNRYTEISLSNKRGYASLHDYTLIVADESHPSVDHSRPMAWSKILLVQKYLPEYDYIAYMDMDTLIMDPSIKLEWIIERSSTANLKSKDAASGAAAGASASVSSLSVSSADRQERSGLTDMIMTEDWNGPNTGVFLVRNSAWSHWLLKEWWGQEQLVKGAFTFEYEQRGLHFLLQTKVWRSRHPELVYSGVSSAIWKHISVLPQCVMNSYIVHPLQSGNALVRAYGDHARYNPTCDFVLHMAGKKGEVRLRLMDFFAVQAASALTLARMATNAG